MRKSIIYLLMGLGVFSYVWLIISSFNLPKCDHVFVQVEQANLKIKNPDMSGSVMLLPYSWPTGIQEGKELVCVKCFHRQKQLLDYGQPISSPYPEIQLPESLHSFSLADSCYFNSGRTLSVKGDTLLWSK